MNTAEVVIIGGGVIGLSTALHLAKNGWKNVVLLEKSYIGSGATERCAGGIRQQFSTQTNILMSIESVRFFERFEEETGQVPDFRQHGYLMLATTEPELKMFKKNIDLQRHLGVKVDLLEPDEIGLIIPLLNREDLLGATFCSGDGYADPYSVVNGMAGLARRLGVRIEPDTEVTGVGVKHGRVESVTTNKGQYHTRVAVNAAGPWAKEVGKMVGMELPVAPHRRHIFVTSPLSQMRKDMPMVVEMENGFWCRREGEALIFGMRNPDEKEGYDLEVDWGFLTDRLSPVACHRLPLLSETGILRGQAGLHEDSPDGNAIMGEVAEIQGFFLACGFSGHGFMHSPAAGRIMADLISGKNNFDLFDFAITRFSASDVKPESYFI